MGVAQLDIGLCTAEVPVELESSDVSVVDRVRPHRSAVDIPCLRGSGILRNSPNFPDDQPATPWRRRVPRAQEQGMAVAAQQNGR